MFFGTLIVLTFTATFYSIFFAFDFLNYQKYNQEEEHEKSIKKAKKILGNEFNIVNYILSQEEDTDNEIIRAIVTYYSPAFIAKMDDDAVTVYVKDAEKTIFETQISVENFLEKFN